ncbi:TetR/AcrR family transcriptional regulator [Glycomyces tenuis]|uniref:TetR/AcrR family transcriptional regulator n=1 Tax=Glycomyces tenuis TaxID=58116 RepID=UPI0003FE55B0|nr:TetR/AcrR family transcriptional regulator [Glycomyces tenuis]
MSGSPAVRNDGPGRPRDPAADQAILKAAMDLLVERGVEHTSIEQIAKRAGVAKVTVYRRWSSKEDLFAQAIEAARDELPNVTDARRPGQKLPDLIGELLPRWGELLAEPRFRALTARLLGAGPSHPRLLEAYVKHHAEPRRLRARAAMLQAQEDGVLEADADVDMLIDMMTGAAVQRLLLSPEPATPEEMTAYLRRLLRQCGFTVA